MVKLNLNPLGDTQKSIKSTEKLKPRSRKDANINILIVHSMTIQKKDLERLEASGFDNILFRDCIFTVGCQWAIELLYGWRATLAAEDCGGLVELIGEPFRPIHVHSE
jgi:hypothetical protein